MKKFLPLFLLLGSLLSGFTKATAQDATILVYLPYTNTQNVWNITFIAKANGQQYSFNTNSSQYPSGYVGTVPEGTYDVYIQSDYNTNFAFTIANDYFNDFQWATNWAYFSDIPIAGQTYVGMQPL